jgi:hypothetical protein
MKQDIFPRLWKSLVVGSLSLLFLGISCLVAWQWFVWGCFWWTCTESQQFISQEVELPREFFPADTAYNKLHPDSEIEGAKQRESQTIFWGDTNGATAVLTIARYAGEARAKSRFDLQLRIYGDAQGKPWERPPEFTYQSNSADQFFVGCGVLGGPRCAFAGRYNQYLITLSMTIDKQMTLKDFEQIVIYLNDVVVDRLTR